jgi:hypothetical protein
VVAQVEEWGCNRDFGPLDEALIDGGTVKQSSDEDRHREGRA